MDSSVQYDAEGRISGIDYGYDYGSSSFTPTYGTSERIESWDSSGLLIRDYNYDVLQRLNSVSTKNTYGETVFSTNYTFLSGWNSSYYTTAMVESEQNSAANETLRYVYDSAGRITQVLRNNVVVYKYTYNEANGFLVREDNADAGESYVYTYDEMGNILKRFTYDFTTGALGSLSDTKTWNYNSNATFGKMFTGIDDRDDLTWDALGNVTANFESGEQFTWDGRRLACYNNGIEPHWDYNYKNSGTNGWRIFADGRIEPK